MEHDMSITVKFPKARASGCRGGVTRSDLRVTRRGKAVIALSIVTFAVVVNTALSGKNIDYSHGLPQVVEIGASK